MSKSKKGQLTIVGLMGMLIFLGLYAVLSPAITDFSQQVITNGNLTGVSAFLMSSIHLWIILGFIMTIFAMATYTYQQG